MQPRPFRLKIAPPPRRISRLLSRLFGLWTALGVGLVMKLARPFEPLIWPQAVSGLPTGMPSNMDRGETMGMSHRDRTEIARQVRVESGDEIDEAALEVLAYLRGFDELEMADRCGLGPDGEDCEEYHSDYASDLAYVTSKMRDVCREDTNGN